ncbi:MAG: TetR/AcrR family transcriptional regulator C-terminal domain-containing protein [Actinomycetota bacterium]|nr:TetR/AcrR family transcriptional regulator C-terminal domain-containing protein [Actinomycetota bacterium]
MMAFQGVVAYMYVYMYALPVSAFEEGPGRPRARTREEVSGQRARWGTISRQQVVDAATRVVGAGGYEQMTIRSLAGELGVSPMSLYRHVRDKDDLLDEVVDRLLSEVWCPRVPEVEWRAWIAEAADKLRRFLVSQPAALHVYLAHPVVSSSAIARMEAMMRVLSEAGLSEAAARRAYGAIHTYTIGFAALEASRAHEVRIEREADDLARELAAYTTPQQFAEGLGYLLEGISLAARRDVNQGLWTEAGTTDPSR